MDWNLDALVLLAAAAAAVAAAAAAVVAAFLPAFASASYDIPLTAAGPGLAEDFAAFLATFSTTSPAVVVVPQVMAGLDSVLVNAAAAADHGASFAPAAVVPDALAAAAVADGLPAAFPGVLAVAVAAPAPPSDAAAALVGAVWDSE